MRSVHRKDILFKEVLGAIKTVLICIVISSSSVLVMEYIKKIDTNDLEVMPVLRITGT